MKGNENMNRKVASFILGIILSFSLTACGEDVGKSGSTDIQLTGGGHVAEAESEGRKDPVDDILSTPAAAIETPTDETTAEDENASEPTAAPEEKRSEDRELATKILSRIVIPKEHVLESVYEATGWTRQCIYTDVTDAEKVLCRFQTIEDSPSDAFHKETVSYMSLTDEKTEGYTDEWYMRDWDMESTLKGDVDTSFIRSLVDYSDNEWMNETYVSVSSAVIIEDNGVVTVTAELNPTATTTRIWMAKDQWMAWSWDETRYDVTVRFRGDTEDEEVYPESYELHTVSRAGDESITIKILNTPAEEKGKIKSELERVKSLDDEKTEFLRRFGYSDVEINSYMDYYLHHVYALDNAEGSTADELLNSYLLLSTGTSRWESDWFLNEAGLFEQEEIDKALNKIDWDEQGFRYAKYDVLYYVVSSYPDSIIEFDEERWESTSNWMRGEYCFTEENIAYAEKKLREMFENAAGLVTAKSLMESLRDKQMRGKLQFYEPDSKWFVDVCVQYSGGSSHIKGAAFFGPCWDEGDYGAFVIDPIDVYRIQLSENESCIVSAAYDGTDQYWEVSSAGTGADLSSPDYIFEAADLKIKEDGESYEVSGTINADGFSYFIRDRAFGNVTESWAELYALFAAREPYGLENLYVVFNWCVPPTSDRDFPVSTCVLSMEPCEESVILPEYVIDVIG